MFGFQGGGPRRAALVCNDLLLLERKPPAKASVLAFDDIASNYNWSSKAGQDYCAVLSTPIFNTTIIIRELSSNSL